MRVKNLNETAAQSKKRSLKDEVVNQPRKRARTSAARTQTAANPLAALTKLDSALAEHSGTSISEEEDDSNIVQKGRELRVSISQSGRFGRAVRLPTRFRK